MTHKEYLSSAALTCMIVAGSAHAQTAAPAQLGAAHAQSVEATGEDQSGLAEVVVTAQRVVSTAQKTPIALEVFDSSKLAQSGVGSIQDLTRIAPNLNFTNVQGEAHLTLRGITSS